MGFGVWGLGFGVWGLGFRVWGLKGFRALGSRPEASRLVGDDDSRFSGIAVRIVVAGLRTLIWGSRVEGILGFRVSRD